MLEEYLKFRLLQKLWHKESKQINIIYNTKNSKTLPKTVQKLMVSIKTSKRLILNIEKLLKVFKNSNNHKVKFCFYLHWKISKLWTRKNQRTQNRPLSRYKIKIRNFLAYILDLMPLNALYSAITVKKPTPLWAVLPHMWSSKWSSLFHGR